MRCPDCSKFVGLEMQDPEDVALDLASELDGPTLHLSVSMTARIVRSCAECSTELKEANLEAEDEVEVEACTIVKCMRKTSVEGAEIETYDWLDDKHGDPDISDTNIDQIEEGGGRYAKSYYGAQVTYEVKCKCGELLHEGEITDKIAASAMDELV